MEKVRKNKLNENWKKGSLIFKLINEKEKKYKKRQEITWTENDVSEY